MAAPDLNKICNIAGYPIYSWAAEQLNVRAKKGSTPSRSDSDLLYLANKGAWIRVISSIDLNKDSNSPDGKLTKHIEGLMPRDIITDISKEKLAKNFVLYGGTSTWNNGSMKLKSGIEPGGAYNMLGNNEVQNFGYRPMPGITNVSIESLGRLGSFRQATINFKVWDKNQLDLMDVLYFRLGYSVIIEWGHAKYYDNKGNLQSSEKFMIDPFPGTITNRTPEDILIHLNTNAQSSYGNYGGMFGVISNFDFMYSQEGGYDCTIKVLSMGAVYGNMPVNRPSILTKVYENQLDKFLNKEKQALLEKEKLRIQKEQDEAIKKAKSALNLDEWAYILNLDQGSMDKPLVGNPIATLLHNTDNIKADAFPGAPTPEPIVTELSAGKLEKIRVEVRNYKSKHDIYYSSFIGITGDVSSNFNSLFNKLTVNVPALESQDKLNPYKGKIFYIEDRADFGPIIYLVDKGTYLVGKTKSEGSKVKLDLGGKQVVDFILKPENDDLGDSSEGIPLRTSYIRYGKTSNSLTQFKNEFTADDRDVYYSIKLKYPEGKKETAKAIFSNSETKYEVVSIENNLPNTYLPKIILRVSEDSNKNFFVELGAEKKGTTFLQNVNWNNLADLSLITSIEFPPTDQDLTKNQVIDAYNKAITDIKQKSSKDLQSVTDSIKVDITEIKKTLEAESAIELMLKSILLYGISGDTSKKEFIKQLFSEGAYSKFFSNGYPNKTTSKDLFNKYVEGNLTKEERLLLNLIYGNNYQLLSCENVYATDGTLKNLFDIIPKVDFESLFEINTVSYGESPFLGNSTIFQSQELKKSVYINLGLFFLMLNHTGVLYAMDEKNSEVITPLSYIDFNPNTNFYLSSVNHISVDPYKFLIGYYGKESDYKKLFDKSILDGDTIKIVTEQVDKTTGEVSKVNVDSPKLFNPDQDRLTIILPKDQKNPLKETVGNPYVGRLMNVQVNVNYLLKIINKYATSSNTHEVYFQTVIERILDDLFKSSGCYNAFTLSYNDNSNCYHIIDEQIQPADTDVVGTHTSMITGKESYEIPMYTTDSKTSIVRSFEVRTDVSNRIASMIAISANPTVESQVGLGRDSSDFGIYNLGTEDRYKKFTGDSNTIGPDKNVQDNGQMAEIAANFNKVVKTIYFTFSGLDVKDRINLSEEEVSRATNYYIERMSYVKNQQSGSVHSLVIPIKSSITMDGISSLYPFQLYTVPELLLPYRYSVSNLGKKVAFSINKITHTFEGSQWTTQFNGFMTLLKEASYYKSEGELRKIKAPTRPTSGGYTTKDTSSKKTTIEFIMKRLKSAGYNDFAVSAIIGSLYQESTGLIPTIKNPSTGAYGIVQWLGDRLAALVAKRGYDTLPVQVDYMISELSTSESFSGNKLKTSNTLAEAIAGMGMYERFADVTDTINQVKNIGSKTTSKENNQNAYNIILNKLNTSQPENNEWGFRIAYTQDIYNKILRGDYKYN